MNVYLPYTSYDYTKMQGPAPSGFHVPANDEWQGLKTIMTSLSLTTGDSWRINLHMPFAGYRLRSSASLSAQGSACRYWSCSPRGSEYPTYARYFGLSSNVSAFYDTRDYGFSLRCFKNSFVKPTSSWTVISGTLGSAGIFRNQTDGIISITSDGINGYTIADKNLGATTVYNNGDTLSQANCGTYFQWGNNYGFARTGSVTTSSTRVDASNYGPGNYYSSSTFITRTSSPFDRSSVQNDNLWGGVTGVNPMSELKNAYIGDGWWRLSTDFTQYSSLAEIQAQGWTGTTNINKTPTYTYSSSGIGVTSSAVSTFGGIYVKLPAKITNQNKVIMEYTGSVSSSESGVWASLCTTPTPNLTTNNQTEFSYMQSYRNSATDQGLGTSKSVNGTKTRDVWHSTRSVMGSAGIYSAKIVIDLPNSTVKWTCTSPSGMAYTSEVTISSAGMECIVGTEYFIIWGVDYSSGLTTYIRSGEIAIL